MSNVKTLVTPVNYWGVVCDTLVINPNTQNNNATMQVVAQVSIVPSENVVNGLPQVVQGAPNQQNPQNNGLRLVNGFSKTVSVTVTSMETEAVYGAIVTSCCYTVNS